AAATACMDVRVKRQDRHASWLVDAEILAHVPEPGEPVFRKESGPNCRARSPNPEPRAYRHGSLPRVVARLALLAAEKRLLDLVVDAQQPLLGARGAVAEVGGLGLGGAQTFLRRPQLERQLVREIHGACAVLLGHLRGLLQQRYDGTAGIIRHDAGVRLAFRRGCERNNRTAWVGRIATHRHSLRYRSAQ